MVESYAEKMKNSKVRNRDFENWDSILDEGILKCGEFSDNYKIFLSIMRLGIIFHELWEEDLKRFNMTVAQTNILTTLYFSRKEEMSQEELSSKMLTSKANISGIIRRLEEKKYIERRTNPENKREKLLKISRAGEKFMSDYFKNLDETHKSQPRILNKSDSKFLLEKIGEIKLKTLKCCSKK